MSGDIKVAKSYSEMRRIASNKDIYILTEFGFFVRVTKQDLKLSIGKHKFVYYLKIFEHSVYIDNMKMQ